MKSLSKCIIFTGVAALLTFGIISFSCSKTQVTGTADTVYAESKSQIVPADALKIVEALQKSFRAISDGVLPSVVEVDVTETKTVQTIDPFEDFRKFFFGMPDFEEDDDKNKDGNDKKKRERKFEQKGLGSGVIVKRTGKTLYVLTNNHVAGEATKISIKLNDDRKFEGKLVGADARMDIALVSFESDDKSIPVASLGDSDAVKTGDICLAMGAPLGYSQSVTQGIVSAKGRSGSGIGNINDFIQTDAAINQGNSGGPLCDVSGKVIGIISLKIVKDEVEGMGFAIPIEDALKYASLIEDGGEVVRPYLGIGMLDLSQEYYLWQNRINIPEGVDEGVAVVSVENDSPAGKAGIKKGDIITKINNNDTGSLAEFRYELYKYNVGDKVKITFYRDGKEQSVNVTLGKNKNS